MKKAMVVYGHKEDTANGNQPQCGTDTRAQTCFFPSASEAMGPLLGPAETDRGIAGVARGEMDAVGGWEYAHFEGAHTAVRTRTSKRLFCARVEKALCNSLGDVLGKDLTQKRHIHPL